MRFHFITAVLMTLQATSTVALVGPRGVERSLEQRRTFKKCGNEVVPAELSRVFGGLGVSARDVNERAVVTLSVNTYMHVVNTPATKNRYPKSQLQSQFDYLNKAYAPYGITFKLVGLDYTINTKWATGGAELEMKKALRRGGYADLNLYFLQNPDSDESVLGICTFPTADALTNADTFTKDGCMTSSETMPGGNQAPYNLGTTTVHEVGHWFGLFHPFQGMSCTGTGDFVADTPDQSTASFGCDATKDSCPTQPGLDNIHNYMDYSDDSCLTLFTNGQITRADAMYAAFRAGR